jgi:hypothetical protein
VKKKGNRRFFRGDAGLWCERHAVVLVAAAIIDDEDVGLLDAT